MGKNSDSLVFLFLHMLLTYSTVFVLLPVFQVCTVFKSNKLCHMMRNLSQTPFNYHHDNATHFPYLSTYYGSLQRLQQNP